MSYYYHTKVNYKREKQPDGSVTVTRTPEFDGDGLTMILYAVVGIPLMVFLMGMMVCVLLAITIVHFEAIPTVWDWTWKIAIGAFFVGCLSAPFLIWVDKKD